MDIRNELNQIDKEVTNAERDLARSEGQLKVLTSSLKKLGVAFNGATKAIGGMKKELEKIDGIIEVEVKDLKDNYEW